MYKFCVKNKMVFHVWTLSSTINIGIWLNLLEIIWATIYYVLVFYLTMYSYQKYDVLCTISARLSFYRKLFISSNTSYVAQQLIISRSVYTSTLYYLETCMSFFTVCRELSFLCVLSVLGLEFILNQYMVQGIAKLHTWMRKSAFALRQVHIEKT